MDITHKLMMDLETKEPTRWIEIPRGDVNTRRIRFLLTANQQPWTVPEGAVVLIRYRKPDGTEGEYDTLPDGTTAWEAKDNTLTITLAPQVLTTVGAVMLYASIRLEEQVLNTFAVEIRVRGADDGGAAERIDRSEDYFYMTRVMPGPDSADVDQFLCVAAVDSLGRVTQVKAVDAVAGKDGHTPVRGTDYWTEEDQKAILAEANAYLAEELAKRGQLKPEFANSIEECTDTAKLYVLPDGYIYAYMYTMEGVPTIEYEESPGGYWYADEWNPTGAFNSSSSCCAKKTNLIPVTPGDQLAYKGTATTTPDSVVWLDANKAYLSDASYESAASAVIVTAPENAAYVWFGSFAYTTNVDSVVLDVQWVLCQAGSASYQWANTGHTFVSADFEARILQLEEAVEDILAGKKFVYDGDSICLGYHAGGGYPALIAAATGGSYDNQALGGARLCANSEQHSVVENLANLPADGELYCFEGGINDFWANTPIGECSITDYTGTVDTATICGAMETIFRYALTNFVGKPVCFVITHKIQNTAYTQNANGDTFKDYRDAMVTVCEKYSIPYYDAFSTSGLNGWNDAQSNAFLTANGAGTADGTHPNADGYKRYYVPQLLELFRRIMPVQ